MMVENKCLGGNYSDNKRVTKLMVKSLSLMGYKRDPQGERSGLGEVDSGVMEYATPSVFRQKSHPQSEVLILFSIKHVA